MLVKDAIINWNGLVKNRLGPYKVVLKNEESLEYICNVFKTSLFSRDAFNYSDCFISALTSNTIDILEGRNLIPKKIARAKFKPFITTKAGDVRIRMNDFKQDAIIDYIRQILIQECGW